MNLWCVLHLIVRHGEQEPAVTVMDGQALCSECFAREAEAKGDLSLAGMVGRARLAWAGRPEMR